MLTNAHIDVPKWENNKNITAHRLVLSFARVEGDDMSGVAALIRRGRLFPLNCMGGLVLTLLNIKCQFEFLFQCTQIKVVHRLSGLRCHFVHILQIRKCAEQCFSSVDSIANTP